MSLCAWDWLPFSKREARFRDEGIHNLTPTIERNDHQQAICT